MMVLHQMYCIVSDLIGKAGAFAHPTCNGNAHVKIRLLADLVLLVPHMKFDILRHSNKLCNHLKCTPHLAPLCICETRCYYLYNVSRFI